MRKAERDEFILKAARDEWDTEGPEYSEVVAMRAALLEEIWHLGQEVEILQSRVAAAEGVPA